MQEKEKRQSQRRSFTEFLKLKLSATHPSADFLVRTARGVDISTSGVGLEADDELQKGEVVKLVVPLGMGGTNLPVFAEVRWVKALGSNYRMGLQFLA
jgi:hypothetical protein